MAEKQDSDLIAEVLNDDQATNKLLLAILKSLVLIREELHPPPPVFVPYRATLTAGQVGSYERSAPDTDWIISVESAPTGAKLGVLWGEIPNAASFLQLSNTDTVRFPAKFAALKLRNEGSVDCIFSLFEVS